MLRQGKTTPDPHLLESIQTGAAERIWCDNCRTDEYVLPEHARRRRRNGAGVWDVDYTCMNCDRFYGHEIKVENLNAKMAFAIITVMQQPGTGVQVNPG